VTAIAPVTQLDPAGAAQQLFDALVNTLTEIGVELPEMQGLVPGGIVAYDGPQFTINLVNINRGIDPSVDPLYMHPSATRQFYEFNVVLLREVSTVQSTVASAALPTMRAMTNDFETVTADAAALWQALVSIHASYTIVPPNVPFTYGPMEFIGPEGGVCGVRCLVAFQAL
jgi:hypothetical protein